MKEGGVINKIEQQDWLKPAEEGLQKLVHKAFQVKGGRQALRTANGDNGLNNSRSERLSSAIYSGD